MLQAALCSPVFCHAHNKEKEKARLDVSSSAKNNKEGHLKFYWLINSSC